MHIPAHADHINAVNWVGDSGHLALSGSDDGLIKLWDTRALGGPAAASFVGHLDGISFLDSTVRFGVACPSGALISNTPLDRNVAPTS